MTLFNEPRDANAHLQQIEISHGFHGYDHFGPKMSNWRLEQQAARLTAQKQDAVESGEVTPGSRIYGPVLTWFLARCKGA